jgi:hypothetical protein
MPAMMKRSVLGRIGTSHMRLFIKIILVSFLLCFAVQFSGPPGWAKQTRQQCNECCKKMGYDEYYLEQCRLKCFRNPDHCKSNAVKAAPQPEKKPQKKRATFRWPRPLNLTPGKEWDAAAQILALNGISPGHPNYQKALASIRNILVEFVRSHPSGGKLPTARLERIIRSNR